MKNIKSILNIGVAAVLLSVSLFSCKYDTDIAHPEQYESVYMTQAINNPATYNFMMSDTDQTIIYGANFGGTDYPKEDLTVSFKVNLSLVDSFNLKNNTNYPAMPDGSYQLERNSTVIPKGKLSTIPLVIKVKTYGFLKSSEQYLLPVQIVQAGHVKVSSNMGVTYFLISAKFEEINMFISDGGTAEVLKVLKSSNEMQSFTYTVGYNGADPETDINVKMKADTALVNKFNQINGTTYSALPVTDYELDPTVTSIPEGATQSGSLLVKVKTDNLIPFDKYLLPVRINAATGDLSKNKQILIDQDKGIAYYVVQPVTDLVNPDSTYADEDRTGWQVVDFDSESTRDGGLAKNVIDNDPNTHWQTGWGDPDGRPPHPHHITIDMNEVVDLHGLFIVARKDFGEKYGAPMDFYVETSQDGTDWNMAKEFSDQHFPDPNGRINVYLDYTLPARYFRVTFTESLTGYVGVMMAELGAF